MSEEKPEDDIFRLAGEMDETVVDRNPVQEGDGTVSGEIAGTQLGPYLLVEKVGEGGFGTVFRAEQKEPVRREVALKIVKAGMDTKEVIARFEAERQALAMMDHQGIARVFDAGSAPSGRPYFVMEFVHGVPVTEYVNTRRLKTRRRLELFMEICEAVQHAHQKGIIHRDLKPSNILVSENRGEPMVKVIDFGVAKAMGQELTESTLYTAYGQILGTPQYMSPEQAKIGAVDVDTRSDIYALGVILYELLTGRTPIDPATLKLAGLEEVLRTIREEEPPKPSSRLSSLEFKELDKLAETHREDPDRMTRDLRGDLDWIVMKAIDKERDRRYVSAAAFSDDVYCYLTNEPVSAAAPGVGYRLGKYARRNRAAIAVVSVIMLLLCAGIGASLLLYKQAEDERAKADRKAREAEDFAHTAAMQRNEAKERTKDATASAKAADESAKEAAQKAAEARKLSGMFGTAKAEDHFERGEYGLGLAYLAKVLRIDPENTHAAERMSSILIQRYGNSPMRLGSKLRHEAPIVYAEFNADGSMVLTASQDKTLKFWNGLSGSLIKTKFNGREVESMALEAPLVLARFHPDGKRVLIVTSDPGSNKLSIGNIRTGEMLRLDGLAGSITSAQFNHDGSRVIATSKDGSACVWLANAPAAAEPNSPGKEARRTARQQLEKKLPKGAFAADFNHASVKPDGLELYAVLAAGDGKVWRWNLSVNKAELIGLIKDFRHARKVYSAKFSQDGAHLITASTDGSARIWEVLSRKRPLLTALKEHQMDVYSAQFSPDGSRAATASLDGTARLWKVILGKSYRAEPLGEPMRHKAGIKMIQFSPDGTRVLTASADKTARIWDARTGNPLGEAMQHDSYLNSAQFSPDGERVLTASGDGTAQIWNVRLGKAPPLPMRHEDFVQSVRFSRDGNRIVTSSSDGTAKIWSVDSSEPILRQTLTHGTSSKEAVVRAEFSPDDKLVVTASADKNAQIWNSNLGTKLSILPHGDMVLGARFSPSGELIVTASADRKARIWRVSDGVCLRDNLVHPSAVTSAEFSPDETKVATICEDGAVRLWFTSSGEPVFDEKGDAKMTHSGPVLAMAFSPDGRFLISASEDRTARIWDVNTGEMIGDPIAHQDVVTVAVFSPDGKRILTASRDRNAVLWDVETRRQIGQSMVHDASVFHARFSPDGSRILTSSGDLGIRVWSAETGMPLTEFMNSRPAVALWRSSDCRIFTAEFSPDGSRIATGGHDHTARIWDVPRAETPVPSWVPDWAEEVGGWRIFEDFGKERLEPAASSPTNRMLSTLTDDGTYAHMARWFFANRHAREIAPFSKVSMNIYLQHLISRGSLSDLREAQQLNPEHPDVQKALQEALERLIEFSNSKEEETPERENQRRALLGMGKIGKESYYLEPLEAEAKMAESAETRLKYWRATN